MKRAETATETVDLDKIPGRVKPKTTKNSIHRFACLMFSNKRDSVKPPQCVVRQVGMWQLEFLRFFASMAATVSSLFPSMQYNSKTVISTIWLFCHGFMLALPPGVEGLHSCVLQLPTCLSTSLQKAIRHCLVLARFPHPHVELQALHAPHGVTLGFGPINIWINKLLPFSGKIKLPANQKNVFNTKIRSVPKISY